MTKRELAAEIAALRAEVAALRAELAAKPVIIQPSVPYQSPGWWQQPYYPNTFPYITCEVGTSVTTADTNVVGINARSAS